MNLRMEFQSSLRDSERRDGFDHGLAPVATIRKRISEREIWIAGDSALRSGFAEQRARDVPFVEKNVLKNHGFGNPCWMT